MKTRPGLNGVEHGMGPRDHETTGLRHLILADATIAERQARAGLAGRFTYWRPGACLVA